MDSGHIESIIRGLLRRCPPGLKDDLHQDAWLAVAAAQAVHDQHPEWGSERNTVYRVARWAILDSLRQRRRGPGLLGDDARLLRDRPRSYRPDIGLDAQAQLDRLEAEDRLVIELRFWRGLTHAEIGARMGKTAEAVRLQIDRILNSLRYSQAL